MVQQNSFEKSTSAWWLGQRVFGQTSLPAEDFLCSGARLSTGILGKPGRLSGRKVPCRSAADGNRRAEEPVRRLYGRSWSQRRCFDSGFLISLPPYQKLPRLLETMTAEIMVLLCPQESCSYLLFLRALSVKTSHGSYKFSVDPREYEV